MEAQESSTATAPAHKPTLLIVDDEDGVRQSLQLIFQDDYEALLAADGPSAIALAQERTLDVVVCDIRMGGMTGIEVLERLKIVDPAIEVIMMTAFETSETMRQALRLRACDYINKPFDLSTIRSAVSAALQRRTLSSALKINSEMLGKLQAELEQQRMEGEIVRTRDEIYASIIHDINNPLTIISSLLQFINQKIGDDTVIQGEDLELIKDRLKRITRQVTNCVEISRRYLGIMRQQHHANVSARLNAVLNDLGELARAHPSARNHELVISPLETDVCLAIHSTDLVQVLLNLAINAFQCSSEPHRVHIFGLVTEQPLNLKQIVDGPTELFLNRESFSNAAPLAAIKVSDNGPGIPAEVLPKIFDPYFTTHAKRSGTGLGLCIVQRLIKLAQGGLHVQSKVGEGTTFTVYLPVNTAEQ